MTRVDGTARMARSIDTRPTSFRPERQAQNGASARNATHLLVAGTILAAVPAQAHLLGAGLADFCTSLAHVVLTPADLLVVVALALLAGQQGTRITRWTLLAFPVAWLASGAVGARFPTASTMPLLTAFPFACAGVLVALDTKLRPAAVGTFAIAAALLHGYMNGAGMALGDAGAAGAAGIASGMISLFAILSAQVVALQAEWSRAAVRVTGSWIAATGVLVTGWLAQALVH